MSDFMQKQIRLDRWIEIDTMDGTFFIPQDLVGKTANPTASEVHPYVPVPLDRILHCRIIDGYGARLSAPGYLDATDWTVFDTKEEAENYLEELAGED